MAQLLRKSGIRIAHDTGRIMLGKFWAVVNEEGREIAAYDFHRTASGRVRCENVIMEPMPLPVNDPQSEIGEFEFVWDGHLLERRQRLQYADQCGQAQYDKVLADGGTTIQATKAYHEAFWQAHNARQCGTW